MIHEVPDENISDRKHCSEEVLHFLQDNRKLLEEAKLIMGEVKSSNIEVIRLLDTKIDDLINALKGKDMLPVSTFKWLVIFVVLFSFITFFGRSVTTELMTSFAGHAIGQEK